MGLARTLLILLALPSSRAIAPNLETEFETGTHVYSFGVTQDSRVVEDESAEHEFGSGKQGSVDALCVAFVNKLFVRDRNVNVGAPKWLEYSTEQDSLAQYTESHASEDASLIQLFDRSRGLRLFFDARDPDSVLGYWCTETPTCIWNVLVTDGELRHGPKTDCSNPRQFDQARHIAATTIKLVEPKRRVASTKSTGGIALVMAGTQNLFRTSNISVDLNAKYAKMHDYAMYQYDDVMVPKHIVTWNKVLVMLDMFNRTKHDWVMWFDTDAVVTNRSVALEDIIKRAQSAHSGQSVDLIVCNDIGGWEVNTGVMLWRRSSWSKALLQKLWQMEHLPHMQGAEQAQIIRLLRREDPKKLHHRIFDQTVFNAHPKVHRQGMFVIHMMGFSEKERVQTFTRIQSSFEAMSG